MNLSELFSRHLKPKHKILCVGGFRRPDFDPSVLFSLTIVPPQGRRPSPGRVHLLDVQSETLRKRLEVKTKWGKNAARTLAKLESQRSETERPRRDRDGIAYFPGPGVGDPLHYLQHVKMLKRNGMAISLPQIDFGDGRATNYADKHFDVIIDAGSLGWITQYPHPRAEVWGHYYPRPPEYEVDLVRVLKEYARIGKKAIFLCETDPIDLPRQIPASLIAEQLRQVGVRRVRIVSVENKYIIPMPDACRPLVFAQRHSSGKAVMMHHYDYTKAVIAEFGE